MASTRAGLIVDAMNVIGSRPTGWWRNRDGAIRDFAARVRRYAEASGRDVTLVVDGRPVADLPEGAYGRLLVVYARRRGPDAADDRIVELVQDRSGPVIVVTADRDLRERVTNHGADVEGPRTLLSALDDLPA